MPSNITARPTTDFARENIFNVFENLVDFDDCDALDLFAGTGAVSFELLSRECHTVTAVEKAPVQQKFIAKVADPPYDMEGFAGIPSAILSSGLLRPGALFTIEHSARHDFSTLPHFLEHRAYGSVNFSIFRIPENNENA